jgi:hypothetical protein
MNTTLARRALLIVFLMAATRTVRAQPWPPERANQWYQSKPWLVGANFNPSTAINQLEMWQADTFDLPTIDRELGWAQSLGFTSIRVFLHDLAYSRDPQGFLDRMDQFLATADKHGIGVMFVLFDSVWSPYPKVGKQPEPRPHLHNSGWVQSPGREALENLDQHEGRLKAYVQGVVGRFKDDRRVHVWDVINEPDNMNGSSYKKWEPANKAELAMALMKKAFGWIREINPSQPITSGVWIGQFGDESKLKPWERWQLEKSDVISFHSYDNLDKLKQCVMNLRRYGRPILCTEFVARPNGSTWDPHLAYLKQEKVGAYCWGFVAGKSQTIYPWETWTKKYAAEPKVWFHDLFRPDGSAFDPKEIEYIKSVTGAGGR